MRKTKNGILFFLTRLACGDVIIENLHLFLSESMFARFDKTLHSCLSISVLRAPMVETTCNTEKVVYILFTANLSFVSSNPVSNTLEIIISGNNYSNTMSD
jgi:hypothetical protein